MPGLVSERLQEALESWELTRLYFEIALRAENELRYGDAYRELPIAVTSWKRFRRAVLDNDIQSLDPAVWAADRDLLAYAMKNGYGYLDPTLQSMGAAMMQRGEFALEFFAWSRQSRRAFKIDEPLQRTLTAAAIPQETWDDVLWPFDSFAVELAEPIGYHSAKLNREVMHDAILVSQVMVGGKPVMMMRLLTVSDWPYEYDLSGLSQEERDDMKRLIRQGRSFDRVLDLRARGARREMNLRKKKVPRPLAQGLAAIPLFVPGNGDQQIRLEPEDLANAVHTVLGIRDTAEVNPEQLERYCRCYSQAALIVVGLAFAIEGAGSKRRSHVLEWHPKRRKRRALIDGQGLVITDEELVCEITCESVFGAVRRRGAVYTDAHGVVRPHWRIRHRRRPAYSPLDAPKTIKVPPRLINAYLVGKYGIVGGTTQHMAETAPW